jgi:hypothetical protein
MEIVKSFYSFVVENGWRTVKKLARADDKEHMMVRFDEEESSGAPISVRDRNGKSAASAAE